MEDSAQYLEQKYHNSRTDIPMSNILPLTMWFVTRKGSPQIFLNQNNFMLNFFYTEKV